MIYRNNQIVEGSFFGYDEIDFIIENSIVFDFKKSYEYNNNLLINFLRNNGVIDFFTASFVRNTNTKNPISAKFGVPPYQGGKVDKSEDNGAIHKIRDVYIRREYFNEIVEKQIDIIDFVQLICYERTKSYENIIYSKYDKTIIVPDWSKKTSSNTRRDALDPDDTHEFTGGGGGEALIPTLSEYLNQYRSTYEQFILLKPFNLITKNQLVNPFKAGLYYVIDDTSMFEVFGGKQIGVPKPVKGLHLRFLCQDCEYTVYQYLGLDILAPTDYFDISTRNICIDGVYSTTKVPDYPGVYLISDEQSTVWVKYQLFDGTFFTQKFELPNDFTVSYFRNIKDKALSGNNQFKFKPYWFNSGGKYNETNVRLVGIDNLRISKNTYDSLAFGQLRPSKITDCDSILFSNDILFEKGVVYLNLLNNTIQYYSYLDEDVITIDYDFYHNQEVVVNNRQEKFVFNTQQASNGFWLQDYLNEKINSHTISIDHILDDVKDVTENSVCYYDKHIYVNSYGVTTKLDNITITNNFNGIFHKELGALIYDVNLEKLVPANTIKQTIMIAPSELQNITFLECAAFISDPSECLPVNGSKYVVKDKPAIFIVKQLDDGTYENVEVACNFNVFVLGRKWIWNEYSQHWLPEYMHQQTFASIVSCTNYSELTITGSAEVDFAGLPEGIYFGTDGCIHLWLPDIFGPNQDESAIIEDYVKTELVLANDPTGTNRSKFMRKRNMPESGSAWYEILIPQ